MPSAPGSAGGFFGAQRTTCTRQPPPPRRQPGHQKNRECNPNNLPPRRRVIPDLQPPRWPSHLPDQTQPRRGPNQNNQCDGPALRPRAVYKIVGPIHQQHPKREKPRRKHRIPKEVQLLAIVQYDAGHSSRRLDPQSSPVWPDPICQKDNQPDPNPRRRAARRSRIERRRPRYVPNILFINQLQRLRRLGRRRPRPNPRKKYFRPAIRTLPGTPGPIIAATHCLATPDALRPKHWPPPSATRSFPQNCHNNRQRNRHQRC